MGMVRWGRNGAGIPPHKSSDASLTAWTLLMGFCLLVIVICLILEVMA